MPSNASGSQHRNNSTPRHKMRVTFIFRHRSSKVSWCKDIRIHHSYRSTAEIKLTRQIQSCARVQSGIQGLICSALHSSERSPLLPCRDVNCRQVSFLRAFRTADIPVSSHLSPLTSRRRIASTSEIVFVP